MNVEGSAAEHLIQLLSSIIIFKVICPSELFLCRKYSFSAVWCLVVEDDKVKSMLLFYIDFFKKLLLYCCAIGYKELVYIIKRTSEHLILIVIVILSTEASNAAFEI